MTKPNPSTATAKILIIEDEAVLGEILCKKLAAVGYQTRLTRDGVEGLKMIREWQPDVVLLDIVMPKMDGYQVLETMQKDGLGKNTAIIIISNSGQPVELERALNLGACDYLIKAKFSPDEIITKIRRHLRDGKGRLGRAGGSKKILMVEDDKLLRDLANKKLRLAGYAVTLASDGTEALTLARREHPHLILLDIILPGVDGFEILRTLKTDPQLKDIPVIMLSNLGQESDIKRGLSLGAADYLVKAHFTLGEIIEKIKTHIN